jgi:phage terminase large subunit
LTTYDFEVFGGVKEFVNYRGPEAVVHGPAQTGKTIGALYKLHIAAATYKNAQIVICRKTLSSTYSTVLQTFQDKVLRGDPRVRAYGGEKPEWFDYPTGARIWMAGLDKSSKILSAEFDVAYVNQAEELTLDDWETLTTRTTGRAGNMPYAQTIGDANPAWPQHWLYHRDSLRLFYSHHEENPALFDQVTGEMTELGRHTMAVLDALTGVRRDRLRDGRPAAAEGAIYQAWNESKHLVYADKVPICFRYIAGVDWGYRNPGALLIFAQDGRDGALYLVAQHYHAGKTDDWWLARALELHEEYGIETFACGADQPAYIDKFKAAGLNALSAFTSVEPGISAVERKIKGNLLYVVRGSLRQADDELKRNHKPQQAQDEFAGYIWAKKGELPVKENDHGMDAIRYAVAYVDGLGRKVKKKTSGVW